MKESFSKILLGSFATFSCFFFHADAKNRDYDSFNFADTVEQNTEEQEMKDIVLYIKASCPFCKKVMHALDQIGKSVPTKDISENDQLRNELIQIGGKKQVPCIVIEGKAKYESSDIIKWLMENKNLY